MVPTDLATLEEVKAWLGLKDANAVRDPMLSNLIRQMSRSIYNNLNRSSILPSVVTETYHGNGKDAIQLRSWPVLSIQNLTIDDSSVTASSNTRTSGFVLEESDIEPPGRMQLLYLRNGMFYKGTSNVKITYLAGYMVQDEEWSIPGSPFKVTAYAPYGKWASSFAVTLGDSTPMTQVSGAPAAGQFSVVDGVYTFSAVDTGKIVRLSYGYIPADLTQCLLEWVAYRWSAKDRVGQTSKSIGGQETVSFTNEAVPAFVAQSLQNFRRIVPC